VATVLYHASPSANRESIRRFGLDWRRMGTELDIPGDHGAEQAGVFLSRDREEDDGLSTYVRCGIFERRPITG
jgi:hypothetical protein